MATLAPQSGPLAKVPIEDLRTSTCVGARRFALMLCANMDIVSGPGRASAIPRSRKAG
jgi:hypothetical protein